MDIDDFLSRMISKDGVLERVDEYTLYSHFLGYPPKLHTKYTSPIRIGQDYDEDPSWVLIPSMSDSRDYHWRDYGKGISGDIFDLVVAMFGLPTDKALMLIDTEMNLGFLSGKILAERQTLYAPPPIIRRDIKILIQPREYVPKDWEYWSQFGIKEKMLRYYRTTPVSHAWFYEDQKEPYYYSQSKPTYAYRVNDRHKLYSPLADKKYKFRNDLTYRDLEGFAQLIHLRESGTPLTDTLCITKASKDVMCLRNSINVDGVAPRGEHSMLPNEYLRYFEKHYKRIVILFDNDGKHQAAKYPISYIRVEVPLSSGSKDPSDFRRDYGPELARELFRDLLQV